MPPPVRRLCLSCGAAVSPTAAGAVCPCRAGGTRRAAPHDPAPPTRRPRFGGWTVCLAAAVALGLPLAWGEHRLFKHWEEQRSATRAEAAAESAVREAREHMSRGQWDAALATLDAALADEKAAALDAAQAARTEALTGQAAALWKEACRSAADRDAARAVALLRFYQAHPAATEPDRAQRLERELTHASDDAAAATLLAGLTDDDLAAVAAGAIPLGVVTDAAARAVFAETLGRNLPAEQRRRAERTARLRTNPAFRDLLGFAEAARTRRRAEAEQAALAEQKLAIAFRELGVEDPAEQQKIRAESLLVSGEDWPAVVARKREEAKARFRSIPEVVAGDAAAFERAVDGELDQLLEELRSAAEGRGR